MKTQIYRISEIPSDKVILLDISKSYFADKDTKSLFQRENVYECTRKYWCVDINKVRQVDYALGVAHGKVVAVYSNLKWDYIEEPGTNKLKKAFTGTPVNDSPYLGLDLSKHMGVQRGFRYVNVEQIKH